MNFQDFQKMAIYKKGGLLSFSFGDQTYILLQHSTQVTNIPYIYYENYPPELKEYLKEKGIERYELSSLSDASQKQIVSKYYVSYTYKENFSFSLGVERSYKKSQKCGYILSRLDLNEKHIIQFYRLYKAFFSEKKLEYRDFEHFLEMREIFGESMSLFEVRGDDRSLALLIGIVYNNKFILMFGGYEIAYIKKYLKYFINRELIEYFRFEDTVDEVVFGTGIKGEKYDDSLLVFKKKFGTLYSISESLCL